MAWHRIQTYSKGNSVKIHKFGVKNLSNFLPLFFILNILFVFILLYILLLLKLILLFYISLKFPLPFLPSIPSTLIPNPIPLLWFCTEREWPAMGFKKQGITS